MMPVSGHNTLPLAPPRSSEGIPRSQSSRSSAGSKQRQQRQHAKHFITQTTKGGFTSYLASRVNDLPEEILKDRAIPTSAHEDHRRRTIIVKRDKSQGGSFGFTLQTYGIRHKDDCEIELITYVDSVEPYGSAARAGMRAGDVILSINGQDVESVDHNQLIEKIQSCTQAMRIVVLFEDCVQRVALHVRLMQLKRTYQQKVVEYNHFVEAERNTLLTLRNKGVDTQCLVKGSSELLPLLSTSSDVLFPFRKHSKSFNRLSVSHSKSESRLLSDSACNLASSSSTRGRPIKDTSVSCSTLPRLGGRRSSARSLPTSVAVTPVGSLDGLEQGSWSPIPLTLPCPLDRKLDEPEKTTVVVTDEHFAERFAEHFVGRAEHAEEPLGCSSDQSDSALVGVDARLPDCERNNAGDNGVYDCDHLGVSYCEARSPERTLSESGYLSNSPGDHCAPRRRTVNHSTGSGSSGSGGDSGSGDSGSGSGGDSGSGTLAETLLLFNFPRQHIGGIHFKASRTCSTDFSDNGSTDGGLSSTEELEDEDGPPPAKPPLPPKATHSQSCSKSLNRSEIPPSIMPKRSQRSAPQFRSDMVTRL